MTPISRSLCTSASSPSTSSTRPRWPVCIWSSDAMRNPVAEFARIPRIVTATARRNSGEFRYPVLTGGGERANEDLPGEVAAQAQPAIADLQKARTARLQHPQPAAGPQPQLGQSADPV